MAKKKIVKKEVYLKFVCPVCGEKAIECLMDGPHSCVVNDISEDGIIDYGTITSEGELSKFQCLTCGFTIPVSTDEDLADWLKEHCKQ